MYRQKFFQLMIVVVLLGGAFTSSTTIASATKLSSSPEASLDSMAGNPVLSNPPSPDSVEVSANMTDTTMDSASGIQINEVMFYPGSGSSEWVELENNGSTSIEISGYGITDEDGNWYRIPSALPSVPAGAFVVVVFDGLGSASDDYDFSDNLATFHSPPGMVNIFEDDADQCALYNVSHFIYLPLISRNYSGPTPPVPNPDTSVRTSPVVAFVAWGSEPGEDAVNASIAGIWTPEWYLSLSRGLGEESPDVSLNPNESIGLFPDSQTSYPEDWTLFQVSETTQGEENPVPVISWYYPPAGAAIDGDTFIISWNAVANATEYRFQLDDNSDFSSPAVDTTLTEPSYVSASSVPDGTYYWRVKVIYGTQESVWSTGVEINSVIVSTLVHSLDQSELAPTQVITTEVLGITWQLQHKDTLMLDLDGSPETGQARWDSAHEDDGDIVVGNGTPVRANDLDNMYCVRASVSMMASYYGGNLSQDRISYELFGGGAPEGDLGHGRGVAPPPDPAETDIISWALGANVPVQAGKPTFTQIKDWINADRPIMARIPGHMRAIDGYREVNNGTTTTEWIHLLDPWDGAKWITYASDPIAHVWVGPAGTGGAPNVRSDEDVDGDSIRDTIDDSDGDGVCDFDERNRFHGFLRNLDPNNPDSDSDLVTDKVDMREYLFDDAGNYSRRRADWDFDFDRKETDPDNDNFFDVGSIDGCEDTNHNGRLDDGETSNFNPLWWAEKRCEGPTVEITSPASGSSDDDCVITLQGNITSDTDLTSLSALVTSGSQSNRFDLAWSGSSPDYFFSQDIPLFSGGNVVLVNAVNEFGSGSDYIIVSCTTGVEDIHVQLSWTQLGSDFDVHLIRPGGEMWSYDDCHWLNVNPDWGVGGDPTDDPELDIDCITGCTLENIVLSNPEDGTYSVKIHYFWDHDLGPASPTVKIWVRGVLHTFGPQYMTNDQVWDVATISWP